MTRAGPRREVLRSFGGLLAALLVFAGVPAFVTDAAGAGTRSAAIALVPFGPDPASHLGRPVAAETNIALHLDFVLDVAVRAKAYPSHADVAIVTGWLSSHGVRPYLEGSSLHVDAPARAVERLLHVEINTYRLGKHTVYASDVPRVPKIVAPDLVAILGLSDVPLPTPVETITFPPGRGASKAEAVRAERPSRPARAQPEILHPNLVESPCSAATSVAGSSYLTLNAVGDHYGVGSLLANGLEGAGVTVAVLGFAPSSASDIATYDSCFGLNSSLYSVDAIDGGGTSSDVGEPDVDVEQIQTQAPLAHVISYEAPNTFGGWYDALNAIVTADTAQVISMSWTYCESNLATGYIPALTSLYARAAAQGQSVFVASGDDGSEGCFYLDGVASELATTYPATDPSVTAVGGTVLGTPDTTWNACGSASSAACAEGGTQTGPGTGGASGGGVSGYFTEPSWQKTVVSVPGSCQSTTSCRGVPDISADANGEVVYAQGVWTTASGTSLGAPLLAGMLADVIPGCATSVGNLAPRLYAYEHAYGYGTALTDVTTGNNDWTRDASGASYAAGVGYDFATGLGEPIATGLLCPTVTSLSATTATPGSSITINGANFTNASVDFGSTPATVTATTSTSMTITVPQGTGVTSVTVSNPIGAGTVQSFTYSAPAITSAASATATVGTPFSFLVTTTSSAAPTLTEVGTLPAGIGFLDNGNGTATLSGTPTSGAGGLYPVTLSGTNDTGTGSQSFTLTVDEAPSFTSTASTTFSVGGFSSFTPTALGYPVPTITESGAVLPSGVTFSDGVLSGTPGSNTASTYQLSFRASNDVGTAATQAFAFTVDVGPIFTSSATSASFTLGNGGLYSFEATGNPPPTISETGPLPAGVTLLTTGTYAGSLYGTPSGGTAGAYPIMVTASNSQGSVDQQFTLYIDAPPSFTGATSTIFGLGRPGNFAIQTVGFPAPTVSTSGPLPSGIALASNGTLSGTPAPGTSGAWSFQVTATNASGSSTAQFTLNVDVPPTITSAAGTSFTKGSAGSFAVTGTGTPPPSFSEDGSLPQGVSLSGAVLSGTPTTTGTYPITLVATNGGGFINQAFTLTVDAPPSTGGGSGGGGGSGSASSGGGGSPPTTSPTTLPSPPVTTTPTVPVPPTTTATTLPVAPPTTTATTLPADQPTVSSPSSTGSVAGATAKVALTCSGRSCSGVITLRIGKTIVGTERYALKAGHTTTVNVVLNRTGQLDLARAKSHAIVVSETVTVSRSKTMTSRLTLKRAHTSKKPAR